jgi:K+-sensing histidine kinase KdpD
MVSIDPKHFADLAEGGWLKPNLKPGKQYGIALGSMLAAFLLRLSVDSVLGDRLAYVTFIAAVAIATWYGGVGVSLTAVVLGALMANWFFIEPRYEFSLTGPVDQAGMAVYLTVCFALVGFIQTWRWAWEKTEEMAEELRHEMNRRQETEEEPTRVASTENTPASQREA